MKIWRNKFLKRMIIVITVVYLIMNCFVPNYVFANKAKKDFTINWDDFWSTIGGIAAGSLAAFSGVGALAVIAIGGGTTIGLLKANESMDEDARNTWCAWKYIRGIFRFYCSYC